MAGPKGTAGLGAVELITGSYVRNPGDVTVTVRSFSWLTLRPGSKVTSLRDIWRRPKTLL